MSMCVRYAGDSYTYLLESVATDHGRATGSPMTRYYTSAGTPPGTWFGAGLAGIAEGRGLETGSSVTPAQMARLFADGLDPVTGSRLGQSPHVYPAGGDRRRPVAGFDCTFTVPKSVSVLWGLADTELRDAIYACHRQAITDALKVIEREVARTRIGTNGVAQVETRGVIAAGFDHWDSRDNDPNLHTHVVIANRVQGTDGRWRTLDSRAVHRATVAMSELYDGLLADRLTARLGLAWVYRERGPRRNPAYELAAVPAELVAEFSQRSRRIDAETDRLISAYVADHGRQPNPAGVLRLRQQATLATRAIKEVHPLAGLTTDWRHRASAILGQDPVTWAARAADPVHVHPALDDTRPASVATAQASDRDRVVDEAATAALAALTRKRSTWTAWNVRAEASRALRAHRFDTAGDRDDATSRVVAAVAARSVLLTPPEQASTPAELRRADGTSAFRATHAERYTSHHLLDAERRLLQAGRDRTAPSLAHPVELPGLAGLHADQAAVIASIMTSGRVLDVLVGPAGSGKTRTLAALRTLWEAERGAGSVIGLAPSAAAAEVLAASLGIPTENTAKWLTEHDLNPDRRHRIDRLRAAIGAAPDAGTARVLAAALRDTGTDLQRWAFQPGQLVIVDEASLAGTLELDRIAAAAAEAGAKLLLVGDWAQLSSVEAGGGFGLLVRDRGTTAPELGAARRFTHEWERAASTALRVGDEASIDAYHRHARITDGNPSELIEAAWQAWTRDEHAGLRSLMIAADRNTVHALNERARAERAAAGQVETSGIRLHDGLTAGVGDRVVTRRNDRRLTLGAGWVKNGDTWTVTDRTTDGSLTVQRPGGGPTVRLPADYVAAHLELGYATTAHRAQGATVDTAHAVITGPGTTREVLYVMLTRAREANHVYVATDRDTEPLTGFTDETPTAQGILLAALANPGASTSAHEISDQEHEAATSIRTLAAEYETLAHHAQAPRWTAALTAAGCTAAQVAGIEASPSYGALGTALRRADAHHLPIDRALAGLTRGLTGAQDPAAVLHSRVERWTHAARERGMGAPMETVVGMMPAVLGQVPDDFRTALDERSRLMDQRVDVVIARAEHARAAWLDDLNPPPHDPASLARWQTNQRAVAAYRDRYSVDGPSALGDEPVDHQQAAAWAHCGRLLAEVARPTLPKAVRVVGLSTAPAPNVRECQTPARR